MARVGSALLTVIPLSFASFLRGSMLQWKSVDELHVGRTFDRREEILTLRMLFQLCRYRKGHLTYINKNNLIL